MTVEIIEQSTTVTVLPAPTVQITETPIKVEVSLDGSLTITQQVTAVTVQGGPVVTVQETPITIELRDPATGPQGPPGGGGGGGHTIEENGSPLTARTKLNARSGLVAADDAGADTTHFDADYGGVPGVVAAAGSGGASVQLSRADHAHAHGTGYLPDAHHTQAHVLNGADHSGGVSLTQHGALLGPTDAHRWGDIDKATSALADIATRPHSGLTGIGANDHHTQAHGINGADHSGVLDDAQVPSGITRDSEHGGFSPAGHHAQAHAIDSADHTGVLVDGQIPSGVTRDSEHGAFSPVGHHPRDFEATVGASDADYADLAAAIAAAKKTIFVRNGSYAGFSVLSTDVTTEIAFESDQAIITGDITVRRACKLEGGKVEPAGAEIQVRIGAAGVEFNQMLFKAVGGFGVRVRPWTSNVTNMDPYVHDCVWDGNPDGVQAFTDLRDATNRTDLRKLRLWRCDFKNMSAGAVPVVDISNTAGNLGTSEPDLRDLTFRNSASNVPLIRMRSGGADKPAVIINPATDRMDGGFIWCGGSVFVCINPQMKITTNPSAGCHADGIATQASDSIIANPTFGIGALSTAGTTMYAFDTELGTYVDNSAQAETYAGTAYQIVRDGTLGDAAYFAANSATKKITCVFTRLSTPGVGGTVVWEYSLGGGLWGALGINSLIGGENFESDAKIIWDAPTDWATETVNGQTRYWVRAIVDTAYTTPPTAFYTRTTVVKAINYKASGSDDLLLGPYLLSSATGDNRGGIWGIHWDNVASCIISGAGIGGLEVGLDLRANPILRAQGFNLLILADNIANLPGRTITQQFINCQGVGLAGNVLIPEADNEVLAGNSALSLAQVWAYIHGVRNYAEFWQTSAPADPATTRSRLYQRTIDASNEGLFVKIKKAGAIAEVAVDNHAQAHNNDHATGGADAFAVADLLDAIARVTIRKNSGADVGSRRRMNLIEGSNITLTVTDDAGSEEVDVTIAAAAGGSGNFGTAVIDFGTFPGKSDASIAVTGQAAILSTSKVNAWLRPEATADHTDTEHMVETLKVFTADILAGTGFTIYAFNDSQLNESLVPGGEGPAATAVVGAQSGDGMPRWGGIGTRIWGLWNVNWQWA